MRRLAKLALWAIGLYVVLMLAAGLAVQAMLSGSRIQRALALAGAGLPTPVTVGSGSFSLLKWFQFQPSLELNDLRVGNPPGFSDHPMLQARRLEAQVALLPALRGALQVRRFLLDQPELSVEHDRSGSGRDDRRGDPQPATRPRLFDLHRDGAVHARPQATLDARPCDVGQRLHRRRNVGMPVVGHDTSSVSLPPSSVM